jgi:DNA replication protein DnaC
MTTTPPDELRERAAALGLWGLIDHWQEAREQPWMRTLIEWEEAERKRRSLERRIRNARIGRFKPMADFDWSWPEKADREQVEELFDLRWIREAHNVVVVGPNGVGKSMIAQNLAHHAVMKGFTVRCVSASELLNDLAAQDGATALQRRFARYCQPQLLYVDELGYLSYDNRHADLLFEIVTRRYLNRSILITTNKPFAEWNEVFPSASCVVTLVDRLVHRAEIVQVHGSSYRLKEAKEQAARKAKERATKKRHDKPTRS